MTSAGRTVAIFGAVLAGGRGRRFGGPSSAKPEARVGGASMVERAVRVLDPNVPRVGVVAGHGLPPPTTSAPVRHDARPDVGPLEGLRTALEWAAEHGAGPVVVLACDLPLLTSSDIGALVAAYEGGDGLVPLVDGRPQPLAGVYASSLLDRVEARIASGEHAMTSLVEDLGIRTVDATALGIPLEHFLNVNRPDDLETAERLFGARTAAARTDGVRTAGESATTVSETDVGTPPVVCVVGLKDSGKTTLVVRLVEELVRRGRRVMTAKHGHHFELDRPGTDSHRHRHEGGAERVLLVGPDGMALQGGWGPEVEPDLAELAGRYLGAAELVVAEGWKGGAEPKIEIHRSAAHERSILSTNPRNAATYLALVSDTEAEGGTYDPAVSVFDLEAPDLVPRLADLIERELL